MSIGRDAIETELHIPWCVITICRVVFSFREDEFGAVCWVGHMKDFAAQANDLLPIIFCC
jgi:hypothetical protein